MVKNRFTSSFVKRWLASILCMGLLIGGTSTTLSVFAQERSELIVAVDTAFVPFEFKKGATYTGFDIDLWDAIAKQLNLKYKLQPMDFTGLIPGLQTRNIDAALAGMSIREDRQKVVDFSDPYYKSGLSILVNTKNNTIKNVQDLKGKSIGVKTGTATVDFLRKNVPTAKLSPFPNINDAFLELATGRVDSVVHDTPNVEYYAITGGKGKVKVVGSMDSHESYGIAFPKGSPIVADVNRALATLKSNGQYEAIYVKWFGKKP